MPKKVYTSFSDLRSDMYGFDSETIQKTLSVKTIRRSYLSLQDAVYDFRVGHEVLVEDTNSPFYGCTVSVLDTPTLRQHGYTGIQITYNVGLEPVTLPLIREVF